ncbi:endonuclease/exonuclease/phosphatase family protein [Leadbetterella sp. DM7]|uniref:endonuclease/exonuclease/phosphatase family protein n=1 Tax=Leadbetterella sp. DM7 TaxID=3235085 RepID=UPI00349EA9BD
MMFLRAVADFIRKFFFLINILFALYSLLVYQLVFSANIQHWIGGFLMLSFPLVLLGNLFFVVVWALGRSAKALLSLVLLFMTWSIKDRTFRFGFGEKQEGRVDFSLLSYNIMYADFGNYRKGHAGKDTKGISESVVSIPADIKCFQEFYNDESTYEFDLIRRTAGKNPYYVYMHSEKGNDRGEGTIGLATFSRYPIIRKEEMYWPTNNNGLLSTDIVVNGDTIRVINFQLKSMGIRVNKMFDNRHKLNKKETRTVLSQLKNGFSDRGNEVGVLETWISRSPYPVIVAGDLNELPYGYAYGKLRRLLHNGFEEAGTGFGFTYRKILSFLRIDNQFFDPQGFRIIRFNTLNQYKYSDHYPVYGEYEIVSGR